MKLLASLGSHGTKWADKQHRPAGFESRLVPDLPLPFIPTLIGLRTFELVSSPVWWETATNKRSSSISVTQSRVISFAKWTDSHYPTGLSASYQLITFSPDILFLLLEYIYVFLSTFLRFLCLSFASITTLYEPNWSVWKLSIFQMTECKKKKKKKKKNLRVSFTKYGEFYRRKKKLCLQLNPFQWNQ